MSSFINNNIFKSPLKVYYSFISERTTHYSYDVHGDVTTLLQDNPALSSIKQRFKRLDYDYDQISGKVNDVHYQNGQPDAFHHHYEYDTENRLRHIYTSRLEQPLNAKL